MLSGESSLTPEVENQLVSGFVHVAIGRRRLKDAFFKVTESQYRAGANPTVGSG
jgi:hypothetical protein